MLILSAVETIAVVREYGRKPNASAVTLLNFAQEFIRRLSAHELYILAHAQKICAKTDRYGNLENVRLRKGISHQTVSRLLNPLQAGACKGITKRRQGKGAINWVPHFERSDLGITGAFKRIVSPLDFPNRRYAIGKIDAPLAQAS